LQGAVSEQGLASSPMPETQVREACACMSKAAVKRMMVKKTARKMNEFIMEAS
jgi:hypothetical protein